MRIDGVLTTLPENGDTPLQDHRVPASGSPSTRLESARSSEPCFFAATGLARP